MIRKAFAEMLGTFLLVLFGCGSVCLHLSDANLVNNLGIALSFGAIVGVGIMIFSRTSGAHMNPAVSLYFYLIGRLSTKEFGVYSMAQIIGATLSSVVLLNVFPNIEHHGSTFPKVGVAQTWFIEYGLTTILILAIAYLHDATRNQVALSIGGIIFLEAFIFGPLTGASMNPARSFGPLLIDQELSHFWIYLSSQLCASVTCGLIILALSKRAIKL